MTQKMAEYPKTLWRQATWRDIGRTWIRICAGGCESFFGEDSMVYEKIVQESPYFQGDDCTELFCRACGQKEKAKVPTLAKKYRIKERRYNYQATPTIVKFAVEEQIEPRKWKVVTCPATARPAIFDRKFMADALLKYLLATEKANSLREAYVSLMYSEPSE